MSVINTEEIILDDNNDDLQIMSTNEKELDDMGVYDLHVKGPNFWQEFIKKGGIIPKEIWSPLRVFGFEYSELEEFYTK